MAHALHYVDTSKPDRTGVRARRRAVGRMRSIAALKQRALIARLKAKAEQADDPANWTTLTGMSDDEMMAALMGE